MIATGHDEEPRRRRPEGREELAPPPFLHGRDGALRRPHHERVRRLEPGRGGAIGQVVDQRLVAPHLYALGGPGWYHQKLDFSPDLEALGFADQKGTTFGWHVGAGAVARISPRVGLYGEGRWTFLDPDRDLNRQTVDQIEDFDYNSSHFLAGVNFYF